MSEAQERVREAARALGIEIPESRLEQLSVAWEQALQETELIRQNPTPTPAPSAFDASWSEKR